MKEIYAALPGKAEFDESRYYLGGLCKNGHAWGSSKFSLRRKANRQCLECFNAASRESYARRIGLEGFRDKRRKQQRFAASQRRALNGRKSRAKGAVGEIVPVVPGIKGAEALAVRAVMARGHEMGCAVQVLPEYKTLWESLKALRRSPSVARLVMDEQRRYWREHPEARLLVEREQKRRDAAWKHKHDPEYRLYHRQKSKRRKAMMRDSVAVQVEAKQLRARFAQFDHCCAYCGVIGEDLHIEHVVPISKGGPHALGNIIPACQRCNFSKRDHDAESWYRRQEFYSEVRWRKICRVLGWSKSAVGQLALL